MNVPKETQIYLKWGQKPKSAPISGGSASPALVQETRECVIMHLKVIKKLISTSVHLFQLRRIRIRFIEK